MSEILAPPERPLDVLPRPGQYLRIEQGRPRLLMLGLMKREGCDDKVRRDRGIDRVDPRPHGLGDSRFPIDERAVAIERHGFEFVEIDHSMSPNLQSC